MQGKRDVIVFLRGQTVLIPAVAQIEILDAVQALFQLFGIIGLARFFQRHVHKDAEKLPVVVGHVKFIDAVQPTGNLRFFRIGNQRPDFVRGEQQRVRQRCHLHIFLVTAAEPTPIVGVVGVCAVDKAAAVQGGKVVLCPERPQPPQRTGECFHQNRALRVARPGMADVQPCSAFQIKRLQRCQQVR